jgi:hypothetical protein
MPLLCRVAAALAFALASLTTNAQPKGPPPPPEESFRRLDSNRDGKVSKEEFMALTQIAPKLRGQPQQTEALFGQLDANGNGSLTLDEFRRIAQFQRPPGAPPFPQPTSPAAANKTADRPLTAEELDFFEKKIRPVLANNCYKCHSAESEKVKGGLFVDTREGIRTTGDNGHAVVPGDSEASLLIKAIRYTDSELQMPPKKDGGKLSDEVIADFVRWVRMGAPDPRDGSATAAKKNYDTTKARDHWAYQTPVKSELPTVKNTKWPRTDIDRFVLAGLEAKGLAPVADADRLTLLRRVYFDLIGLPPGLDDISALLDDKSPGALAKVVDKLLASPQFGERWGRHWLDVARYAESTGKDVNVTFPHAWRYRDYVIGAFNADKPYDQFLREQIAGDLLESKDNQQRAEQIVATGFLALGTKSVNEQNPRQFYLDLADEQIDSMSQAILGTTIACARCHDHKFDPISQRDYYALTGIFTSTDTRYGTSQGVQNRHPAELVELPKDSQAKTLSRTMSREERDRAEKRLAELREEQREMFADFARQKAGKSGNDDASKQINRLRTITELGQLEARLRQYDEQTGDEKALAMGVKDLPVGRFEAMGANLRRLGQGRFGPGRPPEFSSIGDSSLYTRGDVNKPEEKVPRAFPIALTHTTPPSIPKSASGRRELADWLTRDNPLTARVFVNRVWGWLFGQGVVDSPDNFGTTGSKASNQALLDTLAVRFMADGWSTKKFIREIVLSRAYQLSSSYDEKNHTADPENSLVWRMSPRRLDAECIRDAILSASGELDLKPPLASVVARSPDGPIGGPRFLGLNESQLNADVRYRSVYLPVVRDTVPDSMAVFDFPDPSLVAGTRESTSVPTQALYLLNSEFVGRQAQSLAERVRSWKPAQAPTTADGMLHERVRIAYWLVFTRAPSETEFKAAADFFAKFPDAVKQTERRRFGQASPLGETAAWTSFCRALFASAEFRYLN